MRAQLMVYSNSLRMSVQITMTPDTMTGQTRRKNRWKSPIVPHRWDWSLPCATNERRTAIPRWDRR